MIGIYKITNLINGKCYIGQSVNVEGRLRHHRIMLESDSHWNKHLQYSVNKYGLDNFKFELIEECNREDLSQRERYWIQHYNSFNNGFNKTTGGENETGWIHDEETKSKISHALTGDNNPMKRPEIAYKANCCRSEEDIHNAVTKANETKRKHKESGLKYRCRDMHGSNNPMYGKKGEKCPHYGRIAITNGEITKYINPDDLSEWESKGFYKGKDKGYCERMSKAKRGTSYYKRDSSTTNKKCNTYIYENQEFNGSYKIRDFLRENGYPKISQNTIYKLSNGGSPKGYESLVGKIKVVVK